MDVESRSPSEFLFGHLDLLITMEVHLQALEEEVTSGLVEVLRLGKLLLVDPLRLSQVELVLVVTVFGADGFTEVREL